MTNVPMLNVVTIFGSLFVSADIPSLATKTTVYVVPGLRKLIRIVRSFETVYDLFHPVSASSPKDQGK